MLNQMAVAAAGFSIFALMLLFFQKRTESNVAKIIGKVLIVDLAALQLLQCLALINDWQFVGLLALFYLLLLGLVGPVFYRYCQHIITPEDSWQKAEYWHLLVPALIAVVGAVFPSIFTTAYVSMFLIGGFYMIQLGRLLFELRDKRLLFKLEFTLTTLFFIWAVCVVAVGLLLVQAVQLIPLQIIMLALAVAAALHIQLNYPHLLSTLEEIANRRYQTSTLSNIDCERLNEQLVALMTQQKIYQDSELSLDSLADRLSVKPHQLSEFVNIHLGSGFAAYLRQQRVKAAEKLLQLEPDASVLAVGMSVGFSSQSAFYSAFKEIHGVAPGQYRRNLAAK